MGANHPPRSNSHPPSALVLSPRVREIAGWLGEDLTYDEIGCRLKVSGHAVRKHARGLQAKLGVHSRHAVVAQLAARGIPVLIRVP